MNIASQINDVIRRVEFDDMSNVVVLTQVFPTSAHDLWSACTDAARLERWFEPVQGDLRLHGRYRLSDSGTEGTIERCVPPRSLMVTWEHGDDVSRVEMAIDSVSEGRSSLTLRHVGDPGEDWDEHGPGSGGTGWDLSLLGLATHLADPDAHATDDIAAYMASTEGQRRMDEFAGAWREAHIAAGEGPESAGRAAERAAAANRALWQGE
jgi:uncharacterized protein YndB with AHSA1/START domain